jgi:prepilin-type N-terminal cleavage/methylation domain-containing protein
MKRSNHVRGFTIVELLVVIGILGLLVGLLLPALAGIRKRSHKSTETSHLRQIGAAWTVYANNSNDRVLPGYIDGVTQEAWRVNYRYHDGEIIPRDDVSIPGTPLTGPWTWRLMPLLDYSHDIVNGHRRHADTDNILTKDRAVEIAFKPAFAYNAYHVGGWYWDPSSPPVTGRRMAFDTASDREGKPVNVVSRSLGGIRNTAKLNIFMSAAVRLPGVYKYDRKRDDEDGTFVSLTPLYRDQKRWGIPEIREHYGTGGSELGSRTGGDLYSIEFYGIEYYDNHPPPG